MNFSVKLELNLLRFLKASLILGRSQLFDLVDFLDFVTLEVSPSSSSSSFLALLAAPGELDNLSMGVETAKSTMVMSTFS